MKPTARHLRDRLLQYLLPTCCLLCGQDSLQQLLCKGCNGDLPRITTCCHQCALPMNAPVVQPDAPAGLPSPARLCADCLRHPPRWDHAIAALVYGYPVNHLVRNFKFHKDRASGQLLADELVRAVRAHGSNAAITAGLPDVLIPVPLHFLRRCQRGFNQAEVLANELHAASGIPVHSRWLRRVRRTPAQSGLDRQARQRNLRNAFQCRPVRGLHVALVDDVLTTGATLQEASRVLKRAGASRVSVWVAARVPAPSQ